MFTDEERFRVELAQALGYYGIDREHQDGKLIGQSPGILAFRGYLYIPKWDALLKRVKPDLLGSR